MGSASDEFNSKYIFFAFVNCVYIDHLVQPTKAYNGMLVPVITN